MKHHGGKLESSPRLQAVLTMLQSGPATTIQLQEATRSCAIHSDINDLKKNGIKIKPAKYIGRTPDNRKIFKYELG